MKDHQRTNNPLYAGSHMTQMDRHRFTADYHHFRMFVEFLVSGWFAGVYDLEAKQWLWTETVSDADQGKRLILERQNINPLEIVWNEYQPLPTPEN